MYLPDLFWVGDHERSEVVEGFLAFFAYFRSREIS